MTGEATTARRFGMNQIIPIATAVMAAVFFYLGLTRYGFWHASKGPMPGFIPVIISVALFLASLLAFLLSFKDKTSVWPRDNWAAVFGAASVIGATFLIGMIPSVAIYVLVWVRGYEKYSWKTTLVTFAVIMSIVVGCFVLWLEVPFPKGLVYDLLLG